MSGPVATLGAEAVDRIALLLRPGKTHTRQALGSGEDDASLGVVPSIALVVIQNGELGAVDGGQVVERKVQGP